MDILKHDHIEKAAPDSVIVTLFRGSDGSVRGWYFGPVSFGRDVPMRWNTSPADNLLAPIALIRARDIAAKLGCKLCVVDPDDLWSPLSGSPS